MFCVPNEEERYAAAPTPEINCTLSNYFNMNYLHNGGMCVSLERSNPIYRIFDKDDSVQKPNILHEIFDDFNLLVPQSVQLNKEFFFCILLCYNIEVRKPSTQQRRIYYYILHRKKWIHLILQLNNNVVLFICLQTTWSRSMRQKDLVVERDDSTD
jgi:hypothetical protein